MAWHIIFLLLLVSGLGMAMIWRALQQTPPDEE